MYKHKHESALKTGTDENESILLSLSSTVLAGYLCRYFMQFMRNLQYNIVNGINIITFLH